MTSILSSLQLGGYDPDNTDLDKDIQIDEEPINVPEHCCSRMNSKILCDLYDEASSTDCVSPYVITKDTYWPLGIGRLGADEDEFYQSDLVYAIHPDGTRTVDIARYGIDWVLYVGPENEPFWSACIEFQKVPLIDAPEDPFEDRRKDEMENFKPVEEDELPF